jgi:hypothetical protein
MNVGLWNMGVRFRNWISGNTRIKCLVQCIDVQRPNLIFTVNSTKGLHPSPLIKRNLKLVCKIDIVLYTET